MLTHYARVAWRSLGKHPAHTVLNIFGLAVALAACLLIAFFVRNEWSFDAFHAKSDRLHRAWVEERYDKDRHLVNTITPLPLGPQLESSLPEIQETVRLYAFTDLVRRGETQFRRRIHMADPAFFATFDFSLRRGNPETALEQPGSVVLTPEMARTYFGAADPMGQSLEIRAGGELQRFTVTGIAAPPPSNSSIQFELLLPFEETYFREPSRTAWFQVYVETYVLLQPGAAPETVAAKMPSLLRQVLGDDEYAQSNYAVHLQPITDIHLDPSLPPGLEPTSDPVYSYILAGIALLVLVIAAINFMTLSVGRSAERVREVGTRKALGAQRAQLMWQFWGEAYAQVGLALVLSLVLAGAALPWFGALAGRSLSFSLSPGVTALLGGLLVVVGFVAGSYPSLLLSGLSPAHVLRGAFRLQDRSTLRRGLVGVQFTLSIILVAGVLGMQAQLDYLRSKPLGFDKEKVVVLATTGGFREGLRTYDLLRAELQDAPDVEHVAASAFTPDAPWMTISYTTTTDASYRTFRANLVTPDYVETMGLAMAAGRSFDRAVPTDTTRGLLVNEALVRAYGWDDPIGQRLPGPFPDHEIIGVVEDFHYASLHEPIEPLVLAPQPDLVLDGADDVNIPGSTDPKIAVRLTGADLPRMVDQLRETWTRVAPAQPFRYTFLDDAADSQYRQEERMAQIVGTAAGLALFIACFGLLGLAALAAQRRTKEIGIRKALGASAMHILGLLSKEFVQVIAVAFVVAAPVAYWGLRQWLADFAYHITPGPALFLGAGLLTLTIALIAVSMQSLQAARTDPVEALRYE